jgi:hypothetical protein
MSVNKTNNGIFADNIKIRSIPVPPEYDSPVASLSPGLEEVLDYNGPVVLGQGPDDLPFIEPEGFLRTITPPADVNWDAIPPFVTASRDDTLAKLAAEHGARFLSSTSSISPMLSHFHFAMTNFAKINPAAFSPWFEGLPMNFTRSATKAHSSLLRRRGDRCWGLDNFVSGEPKNNQVLIELGKSLERHLTYSGPDFERIFVLQRDEQGQLIPKPEAAAEVPKEEAHHFMACNGLLLRSQLDCEDPRVRSDKKVFDLKTRATLPIRLDVGNYHEYTDYRVTHRTGRYNSFEREFYDMARTAFLKYSYQCRIGDMGGIFVAYHNTLEIFGFEYISLQRMDETIYGNSEKANFVYRQGLHLVDKLLEHVVADLADVPANGCVRVTTSSRPGSIFVYTERVPDIDCADPAALDAALACPHTGAIYVDRLTEEQARMALDRRGAKTTGSRPELLSRLEGLVAPADVALEMRSEEDIRKAVDAGLINAYAMRLDVARANGGVVDWTAVTNPSGLKVEYEVQPLNAEPADLARLYYSALLEYSMRNLEDVSEAASAEDRVPVTVAGVEVMVTPQQVKRTEERRQSMLRMMGVASAYEEVSRAPEGAERDQAFRSVLSMETAHRRRKQ